MCVVPAVVAAAVLGSGARVGSDEAGGGGGRAARRASRAGRVERETEGRRVKSG